MTISSLRSELTAAREENQVRTAEVANLLEQQTATSAILRVIAASPTDIQPVLEVVAESAARFCDTYDAGIFLARDGTLFPKAHYGPIAFDFEPMPVARDWVCGRAFADCKTLHVNDIAVAGAEFPVSQTLAERLGHRTMLATPLMRDTEAIGALVIRRIEVKPFSEKQIKLLKIFADQAVIAIENVRLFDEVQARNREVTEALEQQTATGAILRVIAASPTDIQPVLNAVAESAAQLCEAYDAAIFLRQGESLAIGAHHGPIPIDFATFPITREWVTGRAVIDRRPMHVHDLLALEGEFPAGRSMALRLGHRTILATPLLREEEAIGALVIRRTEVRPFSEKQVELLKTFADQAVIAIENVRLFEEVQARNRQLTESLEQQTATNDILSVISSSPTNLQPVFDMIAERSARLCEAEFCAVFAGHEAIARTYPIAPGRSSTTSRAVMSGKVEQMPDVHEDPDYAIGDVAKAVNARSITSVPMLKNNRVIGAINVGRSRPGLFAARQIALLQTFADQAVIAIENVRLFDEVQARTRDLGEALEQQTATADVLKAISRSAFDLQPVLQTLVDSAIRLAGADMGAITLRVGDTLRFMAGGGQAAELHAYERANPHVVGRGTFQGRAALEGLTIHVADALEDPEYERPEAAIMGSFRGVLSVPLKRGQETIGVFGMARRTIGLFSPRQVELVESFADQAVIAIENVRLFDEVQARTSELGEALQQQTATADVLKVISRSAFDLQTVLDTLVESAIRVCEAESGAIFQRNDDLYHFAASFGFSEEYEQYARENPVAVAQDSITGRVALEAKTIHIADVLADPAYKALGYQQLGGYRTCLGVPLLSKGFPVGVFVLTRPVVKPFTGKQIELVETFADQAVIAIENVRLFDEVQARTRELSRSLEDLRTAQDRLVQTEKLASLGQLTAGIAHEIKNPLNFVNNFSALSGELIDDLSSVLAGAPLEASVREEVAELTGMLKSNLDKVVQHGKRADSIVRNMLLHSRAGSGEHRPIDINAVVEESLNLAYHGARAEKPGFNVTLTRNFDPQAGDVDLYPQEITRVLLNLISNGFYATAKRSAAANGAGYEPTLSATTRSLGDRVEIRIRDNGTGIPPEVKEKMFNPFFTTKPAGEGTGLGLSLSHDIVVKQHAGTIDVDSQPGEFTEFRIVLPRAAASLAKSGGEA